METVKLIYPYSLESVPLGFAVFPEQKGLLMGITYGNEHRGLKQTALKNTKKTSNNGFDSGFQRGCIDIKRALKLVEGMLKIANETVTL